MKGRSQEGVEPSSTPRWLLLLTGIKTWLTWCDQAVVEILKQGKIDPATMDDEKKRETVENYIAFKNLMFKIDKDEDEYDDDGNLIPNHPQVPQESALEA